ncbi:MAG: glycosyltransferase [Candidatus Sumerlaeaceae bacterium]|nr:glycosyltransferase [Candidatus Sumerlaeaceae bacterium]
MVKFAKFLPEFGYDPIVLAATPDPMHPWDRETLREVEQQGYPIYRTPACDINHLRGMLSAIPRSYRGAKEWLWQKLNEPIREDDLLTYPTTVASPARKNKRTKPLALFSKQLGRRLRPWFYLPDDRVGWLPFAIPEACHLLDYQPIRFVLTTSYPNSTHLIGLYLRRRYRIFWIADFRDGWSTNPYFANYPTLLHRRLNERLEETVAKEADLLLAVSEPIAEHLRQLCGVGEKVQVIPNGFDLDDFNGLPAQEFDRFTLVYTGTLFGQRSPEPLFAAMRILFDEHPELRGELQAWFLTKWQPEHEAMIERYGLQDNVKNLGLMSYRTALAVQKSAHALVAIEGPSTHGEMMLTQKVFEYMACGKPILAITPENALAKVIRETGAGCVIDPEDITGLVARLYELFLGTFDYRPKLNIIAKYHRREQTRQLAKFMDELRSHRTRARQ